MKVSPDEGSACYSSVPLQQEVQPSRHFKLDQSFTSRHFETAYRLKVSESVKLGFGANSLVSGRMKVFCIGFYLTFALYIVASVYLFVVGDLPVASFVAQLLTLAIVMMITSLALYFTYYKTSAAGSKHTALSCVYVLILLALLLNDTALMLAEVPEPVPAIIGLLLMMSISSFVLVVNLKVYIWINCIVAVLHGIVQLFAVEVYSALVQTVLVIIYAYILFVQFHRTERSVRTEFIKKAPFFSQSTRGGQVNTQIETVRLAVFDSLDLLYSTNIENLTQSKLNAVKQRLTAAMEILTSRTNLYSVDIERVTRNMDEDDRIFIQESYSNQVQPQTRKAHRIKQKKTVELTSNSPEVTDMYNLLKNIGKNWNFDTFFLDECSSHQPVRTMASYLIDRLNLSETLRLRPSQAALFFAQLEEQYKANPYHNAVHAADVMASFMFFVENSELNSAMADYEMLGSVIACLGHDVAHPGLNNRYLVNRCDPLAIRYNDCSVLEMMHCATIFELMQGDSDLLAPLPHDTWLSVRKLVIGMVLSTDMAKHFELLGKFKAQFLSSDKALDSIEERTEVLGMALKVADVGHTAKLQDMHERWSNLVIEEFFHQGDLEKAHGLKVSMYCDREKTDVCKSQMGFIRNVAKPLFVVFNSYLQSPLIEKICIDQLDVNWNAWEFMKIKGVYENQNSLSGNQVSSDLPRRTEQKRNTGIVRRVFDY